MPTETIYLSTRAAARLAGIAPHVLYTSYRRHGHFRGAVPRKGAKGRLSWPADILRASVLPPEDRQPVGMAAWFELVEQIAPELDQRGVYRLGLALLGSEATPGWVPAPNQLAEDRLSLEATVLGLSVQAHGDRVDQARAEQQRSVAQEAVVWLAKVCRWAHKYIGGEEKHG